MFQFSGHLILTKKMEHACIVWFRNLVFGRYCNIYSIGIVLSHPKIKEKFAFVVLKTEKSANYQFFWIKTIIFQKDYVKLDIALPLYLLPMCFQRNLDRNDIFQIGMISSFLKFLSPIWAADSGGQRFALWNVILS